MLNIKKVENSIVFDNNSIQTVYPINLISCEINKNGLNENVIFYLDKVTLRIENVGNFKIEDVITDSLTIRDKLSIMFEVTKVNTLIP